MENYKPLPTVTALSYLNIDGGNVSKVVTTDSNGEVAIRSNNDMNVNGMNGVKTAILSSGKDIVIGDDVHAGNVIVMGETRNLTVNTPKNTRDYILNYVNIKDTKWITVDKDTTITYDMANGENGWNKGVQTSKNTFLVVPGEPEIPATPDPVKPSIPDDNNENVKILKNLDKNPMISAIDANQVYTPVAFAADLDEEIETGVRKNVDGSVTVVRPFTPNN